MRETALQELIMGRVSMTVAEARILFCKTPGWIALMTRLMARYGLDLPWRLRSARDRSLGMGNALVGMLRASLLDRGVPLWLQAPARELVVEGGRVVGVVVEREGRTLRIGGTKGVVLAAGGFDASQAMREKYLPNPTRAEWSAANPTSTGDAIQMGLAVGAALGLMDDAWWSPTTVVPGEERARLLVIEKSLPGTIMVDQKGQRFVNEALPYNDVVNAMYAKNTPAAPTVPCWLVFDATARSKYPLGPLLPGAQQPDWALPGRIKREYLKKADSVEALATLIGVDPAGLRATVDSLQRVRASRQGPRLPARRDADRDLLRRRQREAECVPRSAREAALLRDGDLRRRLRHEGRPRRRREGARAARERRGDPGPPRDRQLLVGGDGPHLPRPRLDPRSRDDLRLRRCAPRVREGLGDRPDSLREPISWMFLSPRARDVRVVAQEEAQRLAAHDSA